MPPSDVPTSPAVLALGLIQAVARLARAPARERGELERTLPTIDVAEASPAVTQRILRWQGLARQLCEHPFDHPLFFGLAQALVDEGLWDDALFAMDRAIELAEPSADYQVARGDVLERLERFFEAGQAFRAALILDPHHAAAHLRTAVAECRVGREEAALSHLYRAVERAPDLAIGWLNIARLEEQRGALDEAQTALIRFRALAPADPRGAVVEVGLLLARGDRAGALALGTVEMSRLSAGPDLLVNTALAALSLFRLPEAEGLLERALAQVPDHVSALVALGVLERRRGNTAASIRHFEKVLNIEPGCAEALLGLGLARARSGEPGTALALIDRALAREPTLVGGLLARAELTADIAPEAALADLVRACELAPDEARAWTNRAALELDAGRVEAALVSADRALALIPGIAEAHVVRGQVLLETHAYDNAVVALSTALELDPEAADALPLLVAALLCGGRKDEALELARLSVAREPESASAHQALALALARTPEALRGAARAELGRVLEKALALDRAGELAAALPLYEDVAVAGNPEVWLNVGLVHRRLADVEAELRAYDTAEAAGVARDLTALLVAQALALAGRPARALDALAHADLRDPLAAALAGSLSVLTGDAARGAALLEAALAASPADPNLARNLAFACLFSDRAAEGLTYLEGLEPDHAGGDWLLRVALTEAARGADAALTLCGAALEDDRLAQSDRFLLCVALGNLALPGKPGEALQAYLIATTFTEAPPRYLLTNLGRLLAGGTRPVIQTLRALAHVSGLDTAALAVAARAAEGAGADGIDNRALVWLLRSEVGLKFPTRWLFP